MTVHTKKMDRLMRELTTPGFKRHPGWCEASPSCTDPIVEDNPDHHGRVTTWWPLSESNDRRLNIRLEQNVYTGSEGEAVPGRVEIVIEIDDRLMGSMDLSLRPEEARYLGHQLRRYADAADFESQETHWYATDDLGLSATEFMVKHGAVSP